MKAAIITPAIADPNRLYGAERHYVGMVQAFQKKVETEWIQIAATEYNWEAVLQGYLDCYQLDVSRFDVVVSTKNPTYMVQHPRHVCWLLHQLRVFYDRFDDEYGSLPAIALAEKRRQRDVITRLDNLAFRASPPHLYQRLRDRSPAEVLQRLRCRGVASSGLCQRPVLRRAGVLPAAGATASLEACRSRATCDAAHQS